MRKIHYPLEQLAIIKQKRLEEAEKILKEKKTALAKEEETLQKLEKERDKVKEHKNNKLQQLRDELDGGTTSIKVQQMKNYLKEVDSQLEKKEVKVVNQKKIVKAAQDAVDLARKEMVKKEQSVEKMRLHKKEWEKEQRAEQYRLEGIEMDEIGTTIFSKQKRQNL